MRARLTAGTQLHHPADARYDGDTLPHQWVRWAKEQKKAADMVATQRILDKIKSRKTLGILENGKIPTE